MASNGEFVVNAEATRRNRALLEAINAGIPRLAEGGVVSAPISAPINAIAAAPLGRANGSGRFDAPAGAVNLAVSFTVPQGMDAQAFRAASMDSAARIATLLQRAASENN
jgi:hypothetical protein